MTQAYVVVLRCAVDTRVDLVAAASEQEAIGDVIGRAFRSYPPALPLISTTAAVVPPARLRELAGQVIAAPPPPPTPVVHLVGILQVARAYSAALGSGDSEGARALITRFFEHHGVRVDFTVARPLEKPPDKDAATGRKRPRAPAPPQASDVTF